jgi:hypothetical protein
MALCCPLQSFFGGSKTEPVSKTDAFSLGTRPLVLEDKDAAPIFTHVSQAERTHFPYEVLFRSLQKHLMDAASAWFLPPLFCSRCRVTAVMTERVFSGGVWLCQSLFCA